MPNLLRTALLGGLVVAGGCKGGITDASDLSPGVYALGTINGQPLPFVLVFIDDANQLVFIEGAITINADGTFRDTATLELTDAGVVSTENDDISGHWSQDGNVITFTPDDGSDPYTMAWDGSARLTQDIQGFTLIYER